MGRTTMATHEIPLKPNTRPIRQPPRRLGPLKDAEVERQVEGLRERGLIEPTDGAWSSPVVLVKKKDGAWRFCVDYRRLNDVTCQDAFPLPRIDDSLDALAGNALFSTLDLVSGYWQVPLSPDAQEKSAFVTRSGLWKWKVLPFGLTSAPATFQRLMENVFRGLHWRTLLLYLDDVIVMSPDFNTHLTRLEEVLQRLRAAGLKLKPAKCELFQTEVKYLGHIVSQEGIATDPEKICAVRAWRRPENQTHVQSFLGLTGYYRQFIADYAELAKPLTKLTGKNALWEWSQPQEEAFGRLKEALSSAPVLSFPTPGLPYILDTDASDHSLGAVLSQKGADREHVIAYYSKTLAPAEKNYCTTRKELLAVVRAIKHFRPYLYGSKFKVRTDHASLTWLCAKRETEGQVARWLEQLSEYSFDIQHRPGRKHQNADALSRTPCPPECKQCQRIRRKETSDRPPDPALDCRAGNHLPDPSQPVGVNQLGSMQLDELQQQGNTALAQIYRWKKAGEPPDHRVADTHSLEMRRYLALWPLLRLDDDGILRLETREGRAVLICPTTLRKPVIWETHQIDHAGQTRLTRRLRLKWFWPGMTADVRDSPDL